MKLPGFTSNQIFKTSSTEKNDSILLRYGIISRMKDFSLIPKESMPNILVTYTGNQRN